MPRSGLIDRLLNPLLALGRYGFPFGFGAPESEIARLRRSSLKERFRARPAYQRVGLNAFCALSYPFFAGLEARRNLRTLRLSHPEAGAAAVWRMFGLALRGNVPPVEYCYYDFEDPARRALWREYLYWTDSEAVKLLNRLRGADPEEVQDKVRFAGICAAAGLPHAGMLADLEGHADMDLWVKAVDLQGGAGAEGWRRRDGRYASEDGRLLAREEFLAYLSRGRRLVQRRLRNHPEIAAVSNEGLAALRIVTALRWDGRIVWLANELGLPKGTSIVSHGGMTCAARWEDGVIFRVADPMRPGRAAAWDICHPDTGNRLMGRQIPHWRASLELVERAHREAFSRFATLGWDVALTPEGPVLLEANSGWARLHAQVVFGPLGKTELTELIAEELPR